MRVLDLLRAVGDILGDQVLVRQVLFRFDDRVRDPVHSPRDRLVN